MFTIVSDLFVAPQEKIINALKVLNLSGIGFTMVVDTAGRLLGTITDGDIRRGLMKGTTLEDSVDQVMNRHPVTAKQQTAKKDLAYLMTVRKKRQIPLLDEDKKVIDVFWEKHLQEKERLHCKSTPVVLMCGGKGTRLRPLTANMPKPMLPLAETPIIEHTIKSLVSCGFHDLYLAVNYHADIIEDYCGDGSQWGVKIKYIREKKYLGTAGSLSLIRDVLIEPVLVMNGDLLTGIDYTKLMHFHLQGQYELTVGVKPYKIQVPYGIVQVAGHQVSRLEEKPVIPFLTNAGIYVLNPEIVPVIPDNQYFDMPQLIQKIITTNGTVGAFPFHEYWQDIGRPKDYEQAGEDLSNGVEYSSSYLEDVGVTAGTQA